ncbi:MAG: NAD(P)-dependent oxidoreductase [Muribaculaceae bacterium]|nr:NAD(P)-dependent oxidoreductase [Muribaculaceae bacterium]
MKTILIIGAGGFIGGFIARRALELGYDTYVGVRASTSRHYLDDPRLKFLTFDYDDPEQVAKTLLESHPEAGRWDYIIWNLGATKCANFADFNRINYLYVRDFVDKLIELDMIPERFLYMSSLSALGVGDEKDYKPLDSHTIPQPNTRYGVSKIKTETYLETLPSFPWIIFRPTGVYGPHEKDYLMMIKSIDSHWDFSVGYRRQMLTFIYVDDLVEAMFQALSAQSEKVLRHKYIISEDRSYTQKEFREIVKRHLGRSAVIPVKMPLWAVYAASAVAEKVAAMRGKASTLNRDKFIIMRQRNWNCDISDAKRDFGFSPRFSLDRGIEATVKAYLEDKARLRLKKTRDLGLDK